MKLGIFQKKSENYKLLFHYNYYDVNNNNFDDI